MALKEAQSHGQSQQDAWLCVLSRRQAPRRDQDVSRIKLSILSVSTQLNKPASEGSPRDSETKPKVKGEMASAPLWRLPLMTSHFSSF